MTWFGFAGMALGVGSSIYGGITGSRAARRQAELQNEAMERQYAYDVKGWKMASQKLIADRAFAVEQIETESRNANRQADYTDAMNARQYQYDLMIRNAQQASNEAQFERSEDIYATQVGLNAMSAQTAYEDEYRQLDEIRKEMVFDRKDAYLQNLINEGKLRATGVQGRSAQKGYQVFASDFGRQVAQLDEAFAGAGRNSRAALAAISTDKASADLAAYAQRMLDPGDIPLPLEHLAVVRPEFTMPRALGEFDFGPKPVMGAMADPSAAAGAAWGSAISSAGSQFGSWVSGWTPKTNAQGERTGGYEWKR